MSIIIAYGGREILVDNELFEELNIHTWSISKTGYATRSEGKRSTPVSILMHRVIMGLTRYDKKTVDHINQNKLDNRRENLRIVTVAQNAWNAKKHSNNSSGFTGVIFLKCNTTNPWQARIKVNYKYIYLGRFATPEEASEAYQAAKAKYHVF